MKTKAKRTTSMDVSYSREIDSTDRKIMALITRDYSSPYSVRSAMTEDAKKKVSDKKVMTYINIHKRITELARMGLLEEIKPDKYTINIHGRKDYRLTLKGLGALLPDTDTMVNREHIKTVIDYIGKTHSKYDLGQWTKLAFGIILLRRFAEVYSLLNAYMKHMNHPGIGFSNPDHIDRFIAEFRELSASASNRSQEFEKALKDFRQEVLEKLEIDKQLPSKIQYTKTKGMEKMRDQILAEDYMDLLRIMAA